MTSQLTKIPAGAQDAHTRTPVCPDTLQRPGKFRRTPTDRYVLAALAAGRILVDHTTGAITGPAGKRLERLGRNASGRVRIRRRPTVYAPAHRVVWLAVNGPISDPEHTSVKHDNGRHWDNRPANLYLSPRRGFITYPEAMS